MKDFVQSPLHSSPMGFALEVSPYVVNGNKSFLCTVAVYVHMHMHIHKNIKHHHRSLLSQYRSEQPISAIKFKTAHLLKWYSRCGFCKLMNEQRLEWQLRETEASTQRAGQALIRGRHYHEKREAVQERRGKGVGLGLGTQAWVLAYEGFWSTTGILPVQWPLVHVFQSWIGSCFLLMTILYLNKTLKDKEWMVTLCFLPKRWDK